MTVTNSLDKDLKSKQMSNFEYLRQKYLSGGGGLDDVEDTSQEEESESESKSTTRKR